MLRFLESNNKARVRTAMITIKNSIILTLDLAVNEAIPAALKDIDSIKNIVYVHQSREASINQAAKTMGGCLKNKLMPLKRIGQHLMSSR